MCSSMRHVPLCNAVQSSVLCEWQLRHLPFLVTAEAGQSYFALRRENATSDPNACAHL